MMRRKPSLIGRRLSVVAVLAGIASLPLAVWAQPDPHIGKWRLNAAKSVYLPGPPPRDQVRTYAQQGSALKAVIETVQPLGLKTTAEYTAQFDGKDYPLSGNADADIIALTRLDHWTFEATLKKGGKVMSTVRNAVAKDGKTMTVVSKGVNAKGQAVSSTAVFTRQ
jgi:hypothetical protein